MFESFLPTSNGAWFISQSAISNLMTMTDPASNYLWPTMFAGGAAAGRPPTLLGMPVFLRKVARRTRDVLLLTGLLPACDRRRPRSIDQV
jgi:hypothetical protein